ncbi:MAG: tryptophan 7-halogenase [Myxococcota bacterium]|nr:tryptophan 7-halogenase [Myxococcota bacterium]
MFDVVVIGGGPAGAICAARLASRGVRVAVFEQAHHPRFHLGESLLPNSLEVLDAVGILGEVRARFMMKRGARFVDGSHETRTARYAFADALRPTWDHAFQVPRDAFDELLFRHAGASGAELREGCEVTRVLHENGRAAGVESRSADGKGETVRARFVVDASGRSAMLSRGAGPVERLEGLDRTALFTQVRGAWRDIGEREGDIQIVLFGVGTSNMGWFWLIPFADGRTSVGAVVSSEWMRAHRHLAGPEAFFDAAVRESGAMGTMIAGAERCFPPRATADFSFRVRQMRGEGWLALGDAAGFIDPLFSTGAHLAMRGGLHAADAIERVLSGGDPAQTSFATWEREMRAGAELFIGAVQAFYSGELANYLFADPQHPFLRRAITSLLSGDVFDEGARWVRELRTRFPARLR